MTNETFRKQDHLLALNKREFTSYQPRKEAYIHARLDTTTQELLTLFPFQQEPLVPPCDVARVYLAGQFAAEEMHDKFMDSVHSIDPVNQTAGSKNLQITIKPDSMPSKQLAGLANPTFLLGDRTVSLFTLHPNPYRHFLQALTPEDIALIQIIKVDISLNILYIISKLKLLPRDFVEKNVEEIAVHELGHALYFLSANTNLHKRKRLMELLRDYPHPSQLKLADVTTLSKYNNSSIEKQARRWENYLIRNRR